MSSFEQLKQTFFDECGDLLQQIETGLTEMREGSGTDDTINAVFRAVHSVKGGAGIFGFEALVNFAHVFETILDAIRSGDLARRTDMIDTLLAAGDVLADLVTISRAGEAIPPDLRQANAVPRSRADHAPTAVRATSPGRGRFRRHRLHAGGCRPVDETAERQASFAIVFRPRPTCSRRQRAALHDAGAASAR